MEIFSIEKRNGNPRWRSGGLGAQSSGQFNVLPGTNYRNLLYNGQPAAASSVCAAFRHLPLYIYFI